MVKIRDLTDKQLVAQLEKYEKIYLQLKGEREKRVQRGTNEKLLMTAKEKESLQEEIEDHLEAEADNFEKTQAFQLKFDDSEIEQMEADKKASENVKKDDEDEVRVTQLLKLSKEQIEELKKPAVKKVVKKKKVKKKT